MGVMIDSSLSIIDGSTPGPYWWQSVHFPSTALRGNGIAAVNNTEREWHCLLFTLRNRHTHSLYTGTHFQMNSLTHLLSTQEYPWLRLLTRKRTFCAKLHFHHSVRRRGAEWIRVSRAHISTLWIVYRGWKWRHPRVWPTSCHKNFCIYFCNTSSI